MSNRSRIFFRFEYPRSRVVVQPLTDPLAQEAARSALHERLVEPLYNRFAREGSDQPRLRAEMVVAAIVGVILGRRSGAFDELGDAEPGDLASLLRNALSDHKTAPSE